jgi:hypothetical protein
MFIIMGWHTPWTWHDLGAPIASVVTLAVAAYAFALMRKDGLFTPATATNASGTPIPPRPGRVLRVVIVALSCVAIAAAFCVIGRYWTGPVLARRAWVWVVRWMLPVLATVIVVTDSIRNETAAREADPGRPRPVGDQGDSADDTGLDDEQAA